MKEEGYEIMNILSIEESKRVLTSNNKVVVITGVTGQDGSLIADYLLANTNYEIFGGARRLSVHNHENISHLYKNPRFHLINFDLTDAHSISQVISQLEPICFINFAAQSFVKSSWDFPAQTWETNTTGVLHILESIRLHIPECRFYNAGCHTPDTKVLTPNGLQDYKHLSVGDLVYSINPKTKELEIKKIQKIFEYDYSGSLMEFKRGGLRVTPNHTMLYKTPKGTILSKKAKDFISLSDVKYPVNSPLKGKLLPEKIDLSEFIPNVKKQGNRNYGKHIKEINSYDLMYLIGLYIGDGSCRIMTKKHRAKCLFNNRQRNEFGQYAQNLETDVYFEQEYQCPQCIIDVPPSDECFPKIIKILNRNNIKWTLHGQCDITFHQWGLNVYFSECGHSAHTKRIPKWIFELDSSYQYKVLEGMRDSDGDNRNTIYTSSKQLQQDLILLHINCGIMPTFGERSPRTAHLKDGRVIKGNYPSYHIHGLKQNTGYQRGNWKNIPYNGKVWCFEIEENHNFLVERNGKLTFSGNSSEEFGNIQYSPQDENHPLSPRSPYGASKAAARQLVKVYRESYDLYAIQGWLFNHEGVRRGEEFVTRKITKAVAKIKKALDKQEKFEPLELGNLDAMRDWSDAEDMVCAVWKMMNQELYNQKLTYMGRKECIKNLGEYVVSSGVNYSIRQFVELAFSIAGIDGVWKGTGLNETYKSSCGILVKINPSFYRPAEVEFLLGNPSKIKNDLGWIPTVSFNELVTKMVNNDLLLS
jgi:GDP-mannose 4,6-dehydratase